MIWLWIAKGFIQKTERKSLEDVSGDYILDLITKRLVAVAKRRSNSGVKVCCVCSAQAKEENFLQLTMYNDLFGSSSDAKEENILLKVIPKSE